MFHSDIRSMINYIQLNQNILTNSDAKNVVMSIKIISDIHCFLIDESNSSAPLKEENMLII